MRFSLNQNCFQLSLTQLMLIILRILTLIKEITCARFRDRGQKATPTLNSESNKVTKNFDHIKNRIRRQSTLREI